MGAIFICVKVCPKTSERPLAARDDELNTNMRLGGSMALMDEMAREKDLCNVFREHARLTSREQTLYGLTPS